jgi:hypothetical protein
MEKKWYEISEDELESRMIRHNLIHNEPCTRAGAMVFEMLDNILKMLGVDVEGDIQMQQEVLGILIAEINENTPPVPCGRKLPHGLVVVQDFKPYAFIKAATVNHLGVMICEAELYRKNILLELKCGKINAHQ